ncbi:MAG: cell division protein FtsZ [Alphaproteobacteria bacterium]|nr:cell division protein FtsZ [Alphaproteobacteria bacterium]
MTLNISVPQSGAEPLLRPKITVVGVGGGGGNAVNNMIESALDGVEFVVANTDAQSLSLSRADRRIQLGPDTTSGLGAGARPDIGRHAAEDCIEQIGQYLEGSNMAFVTAGMGGGTGTGAAPVVARVARELGILTVGVVTKPFQFEGVHRMRIAEAGIEELAQSVDTLIIIPNQNLFRVANEKTTFADAFKMADDVLYSGVRSVTDLMMMPGLINLDFADVQTVMMEMGRAMMGTGEAEGEKRAIEAAEAAIANPLLEDTSMRGAKGVLINITGGSDVTLFEVDEAANRIRDEVETEAHIIFGSCFDESLEGRIRVSVVATGIEAAAGQMPKPILVRDESKAVAEKPMEIKAEQPSMRPAAMARNVFGAGPEVTTPAAAPAAPTAAPAAAPAPTSGATLAPASATTQPEADLADRVAQSARETVIASAPTAQTDEIAQAMANAPAVTPKPQAAAAPAPRLPADTFIPKAPVMPKAMPAVEEKQTVVATTPAPAPVAPAAEDKPLTSSDTAEQETGKLSLFSRYRSLAKGKPEAAPTAAPATAPETPAAPLQAAAPEPKPEAKPLARPAPAPQSNLAVSVNPADRPVTSHDEEELEIPAFLRRQAN